MQFLTFLEIKKTTTSTQFSEEFRPRFKIEKIGSGGIRILR